MRKNVNREMKVLTGGRTYLNDYINERKQYLERKTNKNAMGLRQEPENRMMTDADTAWKRFRKQKMQKERAKKW